MAQLLSWLHLAGQEVEYRVLSINVNGQDHDVDVDPATPILWVLREKLGLTGTKFGCGIAQCGACTVHLAGVPVRACSVPVGAAVGQPVTTIEAVAAKDGALHPLQAAWVQEQVPQCGYCQSGQIMSALALLRSNPHPDDAAIDRAMSGNICRCGTYPRIRRAIHRAAAELAEGSSPDNSAAPTAAKEGP